MQKMSNSLTPKVNATPLGIGGTNTGSIMGMFALVTVHYPLPDRSEMPPEGITIQTKALDRQLEHYVLTADGQLLQVAGPWCEPLPAPIELQYTGEMRLEWRYRCWFVDGRVQSIVPYLTPTKEQA